ncbi:hypothetical protein HKX48_001486 [Thoreauomyces humboldtii]|nr:hypothetical protein HKX48_001486 [Thoreauomyces humboldtii]
MSLLNILRRNSRQDDPSEDLEGGKEPSASTPLLHNDPDVPHSRNPPRMITADGALIIVYPCTSHPPAFSFELPPALDDIIPSPLYRAHVAELNALMFITDSERRKRRLGLWALFSVVMLSCLLGIFWLGIGHGQYWLAFYWAVLSLVFSFIQLTLAGFCYSNLADALQLQVTRMLTEWNHRAPKDIRFQIVGATTTTTGTTVTFPWHLADAFDDDALHEPQLHIELLDNSRGDSDRTPDLSQVYISPDCDGAMMSVKIIPRAIA